MSEARSTVHDCLVVVASTLGDLHAEIERRHLRIIDGPFERELKRVFGTGGPDVLVQHYAYTQPTVRSAGRNSS